MSELGVPAWTAQLRLDLLFKINSELPGKDGGSDDDFRQVSANIVRSAETQTLAHGSAQALDALAGTLHQTQCRVGQRVFTVALPQTICQRHDPRIGGNQGQVGVRIAAQDEKVIADDLCPESTLSRPPLTHLAEHQTGRTVQQEQPTQLMRRYMDLEFDSNPARNNLRIAGKHQLNPGMR